jgi:outer membrane lipoprotein-sorting protein
MSKFLFSLVMLSTVSFANASASLSSTAADLEEYFSSSESSSCEFKGSVVKAKFSINGKAHTNSFHLKYRNGIDSRVIADESTETVTLIQDLLFTRDILAVKYADKKVSEVVMVVAAGSSLQTVVNCGQAK